MSGKHRSTESAPEASDEVVTSDKVVVQPASDAATPISHSITHSTADSTAPSTDESDDDFACLNRDLADIHARLEHIRQQHATTLDLPGLSTLDRARVEEGMLERDIRALAKSLNH